MGFSRQSHTVGFLIALIFKLKGELLSVKVRKNRIQSKNILFFFFLPEYDSLLFTFYMCVFGCGMISDTLWEQTG